jgi:hypothetical protein
MRCTVARRYIAGCCIPSVRAITDVLDLGSWLDTDAAVSDSVNRPTLSVRST